MSDVSKTGTSIPRLPRTHEPTLVFDKHTPPPIPEPIRTPDSGPIFPDSSTNLLPLVEISLSDSGVESLDEMRQANQELALKTYHNTIIQQHNNMIRDVFANRLIRTVRLDDDGKILIIEVREGLTRENLGTRTTRWSLEHARRVIPGNWHEEIPDKVIGILQNFNVDEPKDPRVLETNAERAAKEAEQRAAMSYEERLNALRRHNSGLETRFKNKTLLNLKVENDGRSITLTAKFIDKAESITWTFDRDGRLF